MALAKNSDVFPGKTSNWGRESNLFAQEIATKGLWCYGVPSTFPVGTAVGYGKTEWIYQTAYATVTPGALGFFTVSFPRAFPKGVLFVGLSSVVPTLWDVSTTTTSVAGGRRVDGTTTALAVNVLALGY